MEIPQSCSFLLKQASEGKMGNLKRRKYSVCLNDNEEPIKCFKSFKKTCIKQFREQI